MSDRRYSARDHFIDAGVLALPLLPMGITWAMYEGRLPVGVRGQGVVWGLWLLGLMICLGLVVVHELAHALAGAAVGIEIAEVHIGHWRKIRSFRVGGIQVHLRAIPDSGYVIPKPSLHLLSAPRFVPFVSAGVIAEVAVILAARYLVATPAHGLMTAADVTTAYVRMCIFWFGGLHVVFNAWPRDARSDGQATPTDGKLLLRFWRTRNQRGAEREFAIEAERITAVAQEQGLAASLPQAEQLLRKAPHHHELGKQIALAYAETGESEKARQRWEQCLERAGITPEDKAEILDHLACLPLYYGRTDLLEKAQSWIDAALLFAPHAITLKATKGGLLIEIGHLGEGAALLQEVLKNTEYDEDRAMALAYLAKAASAAGDRSEATRLIAQAQAIAPTQRAVCRVAASLAGRLPGPASTATILPPA